MRQTPMGEFLIDPKNEYVPGTTDSNGEDGQLQRGLIVEYWGSPDNAVGGFTVIDSAGHYVLVGEYCRPELREPLRLALRDLLDTVDPLPVAV